MPRWHSQTTSSAVLWPARLSRTRSMRRGGGSAGKVKRSARPSCQVSHALRVDAASGGAAAVRAAWEAWRDGLAERFTLPEPLPPLRALLVRDNLAGHKSPEMVVWLCRHGIMPLYTPLGGSWLNMAESIQRVLKRRTLDGQHPQSPAEIGGWFEQTAQAWNRQPTPFLWNGKRRQRRRKRPGEEHAISGSGAHTRHPVSSHRRRRPEWHTPRQVTH